MEPISTNGKKQQQPTISTGMLGSQRETLTPPPGQKMGNSIGALNQKQNGNAGTGTGGNLSGNNFNQGVNERPYFQEKEKEKEKIKEKEEKEKKEREKEVRERDRRVREEEADERREEDRNRSRSDRDRRDRDRDRDDRRDREWDERDRRDREWDERDRRDRERDERDRRDKRDNYKEREDRESRDRDHRGKGDRYSEDSYQERGHNKHRDREYSDKDRYSHHGSSKSARRDTRHSSSSTTTTTTTTTSYHLPQIDDRVPNNEELQHVVVGENRKEKDQGPFSHSAPTAAPASVSALAPLPPKSSSNLLPRSKLDLLPFVVSPIAPSPVPSLVPSPLVMNSAPPQPLPVEFDPFTIPEHVPCITRVKFEDAKKWAVLGNYGAYKLTARIWETFLRAVNKFDEKEWLHDEMNRKDFYEDILKYDRLITPDIYLRNPNFIMRDKNFFRKRIIGPSVTLADSISRIYEEDENNPVRYDLCVFKVFDGLSALAQAYKTKLDNLIDEMKDPNITSESLQMILYEAVIHPMFAEEGRKKAEKEMREIKGIENGIRAIKEEIKEEKGIIDMLRDLSNAMKEKNGEKVEDSEEEEEDDEDSFEIDNWE